MSHTYIYICSCFRQRICSERFEFREHSWTTEAPSCSIAIRFRPISVLSMRNKGLPRHALRTFSPPILQRMRNHRNSRFYIRERCGCVPEMPNPCEEGPAGSKEHYNCSGPQRSVSNIWLRHPVLQHICRGRPTA